MLGQLSKRLHLHILLSLILVPASGLSSGLDGEERPLLHEVVTGGDFEEKTKGLDSLDVVEDERLVDEDTSTLIEQYKNSKGNETQSILSYIESEEEEEVSPELLIETERDFDSTIFHNGPYGHDFFSYFYSQRRRSGGRGPGGGDTLLCEASESNRFEGPYSYDYIQTRKDLFEENREEYAFDEKADCLDVLSEVAQKLNNVNPVLAAGLNDFIESLPINPDASDSDLRKWHAVSYEDGRQHCIGYDIEDETHIVDASNCERCQLFIRDYSHTNPEVIYTYDKNLLNQLKERPRQCSYALIHEWARDFLPDSKDLYFFTRMLHSKDLHEGGLISYDSLPKAVADCLEFTAVNPMDVDDLDIYFAIISEIPPSPQELEEYHLEMQTRFNELNDRLDDLEEFFENNPPLGYNQAQVDIILSSVRASRQKIEGELKNNKISHSEAYSQIQDLVSVLPGRDVFGSDPLGTNMLFHMEMTPNPSRFEPVDGDPYEGVNIEVIRPSN